MHDASQYIPGGAAGPRKLALQAAATVPMPDVTVRLFAEAQTLAPDDRRWPYLLGHVYRNRGPLEKAVTSFERARQLQPDDLPAHR